MGKKVKEIIKDFKEDSPITKHFGWIVGIIILLIIFIASAIFSEEVGRIWNDLVHPSTESNTTTQLPTTIQPPIITQEPTTVTPKPPTSESPTSTEPPTSSSQNEFTVNASYKRMVLALTDKNYEIYAKTSINATKVVLSCDNSKGVNQGSWDMKNRGTYDWIFEANFYQADTYTITITAYCDGYEPVSDTITIDFSPTIFENSY